MGIVRITFRIGPESKIVHIFSPVKPDGHADEVLQHVKKSA
jgi:peroxiredoxin